MGQLIVSLGSLPLLAFPIARTPVRLGRHTDNDIILSLPEVGDHHAILTWEGADFVLEAQGAETLHVGGRPVTRATLEPGHRVWLGGYQLCLMGEPGSEPPEEERLRTTPIHPPAAPLVRAPAPAAALSILAGRDAGLRVPLDRPLVSVGRAPDCDIVLRDETVSWRHLALEQFPDGVRVRDLGSRNGTFLGGERIEVAVARAGSRIRLGRTVAQIEAAAMPSPDSAVAGGSGLAELIGRGVAMKAVFERIREAASSRLPVLLTGETGTGKELAARAIHSLGRDARGPFVPVNCAAIPSELLESEMFGHARGAFTGAAADRRGAFEAADGGTILLDEIAEMPPALQPKLLRVIEDGIVMRVGGGRARCSARVVAATNRDLSEEIAAGRFRQDLFYRLAVLPVAMPPLSDRIEDLPDLVHSFLMRADEHSGMAGSADTRFEESAFAPLREHTWPGNVRELRNVILQAVVRRPGGVVDGALIEELLSLSRARAPRAARSLREVERETILNTLRDCGGSRRQAARRLGIAESTLFDKLKRYRKEP